MQCREQVRDRALDELFVVLHACAVHASGPWSAADSMESLVAEAIETHACFVYASVVI